MMWAALLRPCVSGSVVLEGERRLIEGVEDAIYDSYAMRSFLKLDFVLDQVPDATTLLHFPSMWRPIVTCSPFSPRLSQTTVEPWRALP